MGTACAKLEAAAAFGTARHLSVCQICKTALLSCTHMSLSAGPRPSPLILFVPEVDSFWSLSNDGFLTPLLSFLTFPGQLPAETPVVISPQFAAPLEKTCPERGLQKQTLFPDKSVTSSGC